VHIQLEPAGAPLPPRPRRARRARTRVEKLREPTLAAPRRGLQGPQRSGTWSARSLGPDGTPDGVWSYQRSEAKRLRWTVTYLPTGQIRLFTSLDEPGGAREATAAGLLEELRSEAFAAAMSGVGESRACGQRWLAIHMRLQGHDVIDADCVCGGLLTELGGRRAAGRLVHVDACPGCRDRLPLPAGQVCPDAGRHRFCARPMRRLTERERLILDLELRWRARSGRDARLVGAKVEQIRAALGVSATVYYQELDRLIHTEAALAAEPVLVRWLLEGQAAGRRVARASPGRTRGAVVDGG
jgi:hypothetical protein